MAQEENRNSSKRQALEKILDAGLKLLAADDLKPSTPCPDSWTFALYVQGRLDEDARRIVNGHLAFCDDCYREYVAMADPEDIMKEVEHELHSATVAPPERSPDVWRQLMERLKGFVIDLGEKYGKGSMLGSVRILAETSAVRGKRTSLRLSKLLETSVGNNTYRIQLGVTRDGSFECGIDGQKIADEIALRLAVRRDTGEALFLTETNIHGNADFVLTSEKVSGGILVIDLHLDGHESQIAFRMPS